MTYRRRSSDQFAHRLGRMAVASSLLALLLFAVLLLLLFMAPEI